MRQASPSPSRHHPTSTTTTTTTSGAFHRQSHDIFVLDEWLEETRKASTVGPQRLRKRSKVQDVCAQELFHQVRVGSPKIAKMLERVWNERTNLMNETFQKLEHQVQVRDFAQSELLNVARSAELHAQRTKRLGNQWEVQRGAVMEELRDTQAKVHSLTIERNQLAKETDQLRDIINDYVRGVGVSKIRQREREKNGTSSIILPAPQKNSYSTKIIATTNTTTTNSIKDEREMFEREKVRQTMLDTLPCEKSRIGSGVLDRGALPPQYESEEEDLEEMAVRHRVENIHQADKQMDALLLELGSEKRVQKAAIRGTQRLMKQFLSSIEATHVGVRK